MGLEMEGMPLTTTPDWKVMSTGTGAYCEISLQGTRVWVRSGVHLPIS